MKKAQGKKRGQNWNPRTKNDVQFFDSLTGVPEIAAWAREFSDRISSEKKYIDTQEAGSQNYLALALAKAAGSTKRSTVLKFTDEINRTQDTGVRLIPQEPDFLAQELAQEPDFLAQELDIVRKQFLGLLHRKTHTKNFKPNVFAEALKTLTAEGENSIPRAIAQEAIDKYGTIGNADKSTLPGELAVMSLLTEKERERFRELTKTALTRADAAREKWRQSEQGERMAKGADAAETGETRRMSRAQAAYHVLMTEQADYAEMLRQQGYDDAALAKLREFAGEDVMQLAYDLRDALGARTEQI